MNGIDEDICLFISSHDNVHRVQFSSLSLHPEHRFRPSQNILRLGSQVLQSAHIAAEFSSVDELI